MSRYGSMDFFMSLDFYEGIGIIREALSQRERRESWEMYLTIYPNMTEKNYVSFEDFWRAPTPTNKTEKVNLNKKEDREEYTVNAIALAETIKKQHKESTKKTPKTNE